MKGQMILEQEQNAGHSNPTTYVKYLDNELHALTNILRLECPALPFYLQVALVCAFLPNSDISKFLNVFGLIVIYRSFHNMKNLIVELAITAQKPCSNYGVDIV